MIASSGEVDNLELTVFEGINGLPGGLVGVFWPFQQLGNLIVGPLVALVALVAALLRRWWLCGGAIAVTILKLVSERAVKILVERDRPGTTVEDAILRGDVPATGQSFVSGHAVLIAGLAVVVTRHLPPRWRPVPWILVGLVTIARVYVGAHNPLDVIGGVGLGLVLGGLVNLAEDTWTNRHGDDTGNPRRASA